MHIEHTRPTVLRLTLHAYELATLMAVARWAAEGASGELPKEAVEQLRQLVESYEDAVRAQPTIRASPF